MTRPPFQPPSPRIVIVGGGLAGLAAAAALVNRGLHITVLESRPRLGGRASSFSDPATGELVDNCQHVSMACCTNLADFCRRVGTADLFRREPAIYFLSPEGKVSRLEAGRLPAPFHLTGSFLRASYLSLGDKLRVGYGLACLRSRRGDRPGETFEAWLLRHGQTPRTISRFWATVLVSALNERVEQMDVEHARKVLLDGFLRNRDAFAMEVPVVPLGELYGTRLEAWLAEWGVAVRMTTGARALELDTEGSISGVSLRTGEVVPADFVVLAVPFDRVLSLLPRAALERIPALEGVAALCASPITGIHLWFDRPVCPLPHAVTVGRLVQWVFNHTHPEQQAKGESRGQYLQLVISASYDLVSMDKQAILDAALADLRALWPAASDAKLERSWVVTEHGATFGVRPGVEALRPPQRTPVDGLMLAGDWTDTGWPATMEGAVRSGYRAAEEILEVLGTPARLVRPELPTGGLARLLLGAGRAQNAAVDRRARDRSASVTGGRGHELLIERGGRIDYFNHDRLAHGRAAGAFHGAVKPRAGVGIERDCRGDVSDETDTDREQHCVHARLGGHCQFSQDHDAVAVADPAYLQGREHDNGDQVGNTGGEVEKRSQVGIDAEHWRNDRDGDEEPDGGARGIARNLDGHGAPHTQRGGEERQCAREQRGQCQRDGFEAAGGHAHGTDHELRGKSRPATRNGRQHLGAQDFSARERGHQQAVPSFALTFAGDGGCRDTRHGDRPDAHDPG